MLETLPLRQLIPSDRLWFDPAALNVNTYFQFTDVLVQMSTDTPLLTPNPRRWGIGFCRNTIGTFIQVAPWPDVNAFVFSATTLSSDIQFMTLKDFGPIITSGWWGRTTATITVRVVELIRR
jgi:hypothetical protein